MKPEDMFVSVCTENSDGSKTYSLKYRTLWIKIKDRTYWNLMALRRFINHPWVEITTLNLRFALWLNGGSVIYKVRLEDGQIKTSSRNVYIRDIVLVSTEAYSAPMMVIGGFEDAKPEIK